MIIAQINMLMNGSTGTIMFETADYARKHGHVVYTYSPYDYSTKYKKMPKPPINHKYFGTYFERYLHVFLGRLVGCNGCLSYFGTKKLIKDLKKNKVDILHLHNLHNYCINIPLLFKYIKKQNIHTIWTLHDCWTFTGHCPHFDMIGCAKWKTGCFKCPQYREYPQSLIDNSKYMYALKKVWFSKVKSLTFITPSVWLKNQVEQSFLKNYTIKTIENGIDLSIFKPTVSNFRKKYNIENKIIILGVAFDWNIKKGLDVFIKLSQRLNPDKFQIVLVGTSKKQDEQLPPNIITINRTNNQIELAKIYTAADIFINPTREEVLGLVNIESLACGTPVITFNTGGSVECIDKSCGVVVDKDDFDTLLIQIHNISSNNTFDSKDCIRKAKDFDINIKLKQYLNLYESIMR